MDYATFVLRKVTMVVLLMVSYLVFDRCRAFLGRFDTAKKIEDNPIAIAILLSGFFLAVAYA